MTFQEKYAEKRKESQKVLEELQCKINIDACTDTIFKAISDKLDEKVNKEYDVERIKESNDTCLENQFRVRVKFYSNFVEVAGEKIDLNCNISVQQEKVEKILTKKLREVGVAFIKDLGGDFLAELVFKD